MIQKWHIRPLQVENNCSKRCIREKNNKGVDKEIFIQSTTKESLLWAQQEIKKHKNHCEELNRAL